jgi:hypothetical protein
LTDGFLKKRRKRGTKGGSHGQQASFKFRPYPTNREHNRVVTDQRRISGCFSGHTEPLVTTFLLMPFVGIRPESGAMDSLRHLFPRDKSPAEVLLDLLADPFSSQTKVCTLFPCHPPHTPSQDSC